MQYEIGAASRGELGQISLIDFLCRFVRSKAVQCHSATVRKRRQDTFEHDDSESECETAIQNVVWKTQAEHDSSENQLLFLPFLLFAFEFKRSPAP